MIPRYSLPEMAGLFTDVARLSRWLEIELLAAEAWAEAGVIPRADAAALRSARPTVDAAFVAACQERERVTDHDVAAFVDVAQARLAEGGAGVASKWLHYGLTSSDVVDTAGAGPCGTPPTCCSTRPTNSSGRCARRRAAASRHGHGRSHPRRPRRADDVRLQGRAVVPAGGPGPDAAPARAGRSGGGQALGRCRHVLERGPRDRTIRVPRHRADTRPATQVVARDRHAEYLWACAAVGATVESIAVELRHLQRTEVREVEEGFKAGQKGSSAMPHKRNPIMAERLAGLARILRGNLQAGLEDVALWHERDISHSSVERVILPDSSLLAYYVLRRCRSLVEGLRVFPERMLANLWSSHGLVFSQPVLLALVAAGLDRDAAYRVVQENAMLAWEEGVAFRALLEKDERLGVVPAGVLDEAFSLERALRNTETVFAVLDGVDAGGAAADG